MLTLNQIRENKAVVIRKLKIKNYEAEDILKKILDFDIK